MVRGIQVAQNLDQFFLVDSGRKMPVNRPDDFFTGLGMGLRQNEWAKHQKDNDSFYQSPLYFVSLFSIILSTPLQ